MRKELKPFRRIFKENSPLFYGIVRGHTIYEKNSAQLRQNCVYIIGILIKPATIFSPTTSTMFLVLRILSQPKEKEAQNCETFQRVGIITL